MDTFQYSTYAQEVIFGSGCMDRLAEAAERRGWQRLLLCANSAQRRNGQAAKIAVLLGERCAAVFDEVLPHVQDTQLAEARALVEDHQVDAVIGLGGGSPIGMAKALAYERESLAVIAVPTTYAGSEMTAVCGITHTDVDPPRKVTLSDPRLAPRLVLYDPQWTLDLPAQLTASTGMNALAHCIEALYAINRNPLSSASAVEGVRHIFQSLLRCTLNGADLPARAQMLLGAHLAGVSLASVKMALHHGLCHVLGGSAGVPHGIANSIMLPHVMRFNAPAVAPLLLPAAEALGIPVERVGEEEAVLLAAERIIEWEAQMGLPLRLRDAGVRDSDLPQLARLGFENQTVHNNPRPIQSADEIEAIFRSAW